MTQTELAFPPPTHSRADHPTTCHLAGEAIERNGTAGRHRDIVLAVLRVHPGLTCQELCRWCSDLTYPQFRKRLADLHNMQMARHGDYRVCGECESKCVTWVAV